MPIRNSLTLQAPSRNARMQIQGPSYRIIIISKSHILQPSSTATSPTTPAVWSAHTHALTECLVTLWSLVLGIARQHALYAHAYALHALHRRPAGRAEEVETYNTIAVDVGVNRYRAAWEGLCL